MKRNCLVKIYIDHIPGVFLLLVLCCLIIKGLKLKYLKLLSFVFIMFAYTQNTNADEFNYFLKIYTEQNILADWVIDNSQIELNKDKALSIVKDIYIHSWINNISPILIMAITRTESGFRKYAKSNYGAVGLMQVVPRLHKDKLKHRDPFNQSVSIEVGTKIMKNCLVRNNNNLNKSLNCYSGNDGDKYISKVTNFRNKINHYLKIHSSELS